MEQYNEALKNFDFSHQELPDKPQPVPLKSNVKKLKGKAISIWVHLRNFPLILSFNGWIGDPGSLILKLALLLREIVERISAEVFRPYEIEILDELIIEYLDLRKSLLPDNPALNSAKPKHHFLIHYKG